MSRKHGKGHRYYFLHNILHKTKHKIAKHRYAPKDRRKPEEKLNGGIFIERVVLLKFCV